MPEKPDLTSLESDPSPGKRWEAVGRILSALVPDTSVEDVTRRISKALAPIIPHDDLRISLMPCIETWWLKKTGFEIQRYDPPSSEADASVSALRWVAFHKKSLLRPNLNTDIRFLRDRLVLDEGRISSLHVPLSGPKGYFGVISLASSMADQFDPQSLALLEWVSERIGGPLTAFSDVVHRSSVALPIDRRFSVSLDTTLEHILHQIKDRGYDRVRVYLYDHVSEEMIGGAQSGIELYEGFRGVRLPVSEDVYTQKTIKGRRAQLYRWGQDAESGRLQLELKNPKTHDWAELPLYVEEDGRHVIVGKIAIDNNPTLRPLDADALQGLMGMAESAALAIRNAQLYESKVVDAERSVRVAESRLRQQDALLTISNAVQAMSRPEDMGQVLSVSLEQMRDLDIEVDAIAIHRVTDPDRYEIETYRRAVDGLMTVAEKRVSKNLCKLWSDGGWVLTDDVEISVPGKGVDAFRAKFSGLELRALMDLPFSLGVISVHSCTPAAFTLSDRELVIQMAEVISLGTLRMADLQKADHARDALLESEQRYREIVHGAPVCIHEMDLEGRITSMNPAGLEMLDLTTEQVIGSWYLGAVSEEDRSRVGALLDRAVGGVAAFFEFDSAGNAKRFQSSFIPILDGEGKTVRMIGMTEDITDRTRQNLALEQSESTHRLAIESIGGVPYSLDMGADRYEYVGEGITRLFACTYEDFDRAYLNARIEQIERIDTGAESDEGTSWRISEYRIIRENGDEAWIRDTYSRTLDKEGNRLASFGIMQDVTPQKQAEREMVRFQRLNATWELSAGISHNLNNILTGVIGPAQILIATTEDEDTAARAAEINDAGIRARDLIRQLHSSSRETEFKAEAVNLQDVVNDAVKTARPKWRDQTEAAGIQIKVVMGVPNLPLVLGTYEGMHDVLVNLIFNAVDAMPQGGVIDLQALESYDSVTLRVSDSGHGMDENVRRKLFEPFFTTKAEIGTGLGLYTVYHTIRTFGGDIRVDSQVGKGSVFTITLPYASDDTPRHEQAEIKVERTVSGARILVVEDEEFVRSFLGSALGPNNEVTLIDNPMEAMEVIQQGGFEVVLADLGLPDIPGDQLLARIAEARPQCARVLMTGWELSEADDRRAFADFYVQKPVELKHLYQTIKDAAELARQRGA
jgi:PAS domain S-box-containing protein